MSVKRTLVEIAHDEGYGDALLEYININLRGKDMMAERIVTNQELIDAIEAEIAETEKGKGCINYDSESGCAIERGCDEYINGLRFAKELIEKRAEVTE